MDEYFEEMTLKFRRPGQEFTFTKKSEDGLHLPDLVVEFENFLRAAGFGFDHIEVVKKW